MLAHFPHTRTYAARPADPERDKADRVVKAADRLLEDFRQQDAVLQLRVVRKR